MKDRDPEAERALVQAAQMRPELTASLDVQLVYFTDTHCRRAWETLTTLAIEGVEPDLLLLQERSGLPASWVAALTDGPGMVANAQAYAETLKRCALKRYAARVIGTAWDGIRNGETGEAVIGALEEKLGRLLSGTGVAGEESARDVLTQVIDEAERAWKGTVGRLTTTIHKVDSITGGLYPGELVVLGARTSVGKSALALQIASDLATSGEPVGYISLEMSNQALMRRIMAARSRIDSNKLRNGDLEHADFSRLSEHAQEVAKMPLWFSTSPSQRIGDVILQARVWHARHRIRLLVLDYLTLIRPAGKVDRWVHVGECMHALKELAKRCGIVVLCPAQLNRQADTNRVPSLSELRESGDIEQDADQVWLLHRKRTSEGMLEPAAKLVIAKNREGATGSVDLTFVEGWTRFE